MKCALLLFLWLIAVPPALAQGEERLLKINGTNINVRIVGRGRPILIVHGGPGLNHSYFLPHLLPLSRTHKVVLIDQRACGKSSGSLDSTQMSLDWLLKDMEAIRKELKLGKVAVLAHSWGGLLGILYASRYPQSTSALILTSSVSPRQGEFDRQTNQIVNGRYSKVDSTLRGKMLQSKELTAGSVEAYGLLFRISFKQLFYNKDYIDSLDLDLPEDFVQKRKVLFFMSRELNAYDFYPELNKIKCRTLIVHGDYDAIPVELSQKLNRQILHSEVVIMEHAGHFPFVEKRNEFIKIIKGFLDRPKEDPLQLR